MDRAYSFLNVKSIDAETRTIRGIATTPAPDRVGDVVEPLGVSYAAELPLLLQHNHSLPVGYVKFDRPTKDGITFEARIPEIEEAGALKDRVDEAWQSVKYGVIRAVSIGFRTLDNAYEQMKGGGLRFLKTEILELSLVTVPANSQAVITAVKSIDQKHLAQESVVVDEVRERPAKGAKRGPVKLIPRKK